MRNRRWLTAPLLSIALTASVAAAPAGAAEPSPSTTSSAPTSAPAPASADPATQYASLAGALLTANAADSGATLKSYLRTNQLMVSAAPGGSSSAQPGDSATLTSGTATTGATALTASTPSELDAQLAGAGYTLDLRNYHSLKDLATDVIAKSDTADGAATLTGAAWVTQLSTLHMPALSTPTAGQATAPAIPAESLAFGLLMNQALANTVLKAPDLVASAAASGVGSTQLTQEFSNEMLSAWNASSKDLTSLLPSKCTGAMLATMASGDSSSADAYTGCNPACTTGGLYLHNQAGKVFDSSANQMSGNTANSQWSYDTLLGLQQWRTTDLLKQNPSLVQGLLSENGTAGGSSLCDTASQSATSTLSSTLPGIFAQLSK